MSGCTPCRRAIRGMRGLAKAALRIDRTGEVDYQERLSTCRACEHAKPCTDNPDDVCQCLECSCWIKVKARVSSESCPMGMW